MRRENDLFYAFVIHNALFKYLEKISDETILKCRWKLRLPIFFFLYTLTTFGRKIIFLPCHY